MKLDRSSMEYGGGSGKGIFESDMFRVVVWNLHGGIRTNINSRLGHHLEIEFDGKHEFDSDELCLEQFTCKEVLLMIECQKSLAFSEGAKSKANQIMACFDV